ncbi:MAG: 2-dehydropantoate 2-reductase [Hyphomicrobiales bacterium]
MRVAMIGAGAMGSVFGSRFARAGAEVVLFDRDRTHIEAIEVGGVHVEAPDGSMTLRLPATTNADNIGKADFAVILVDSNATEEAAKVVKRVLGKNGAALTLQNGIGNVEVLSAVLGAARVIAGTTYNSAARIKPGHVLHSNIGETVIGEIDGSLSARVEGIARLLREAGLSVTVSDNVMGHIWMKFVLNAAINPVSAMTGLRPGEIARVPAARELLERVLDEVLDVVAAKGITLPVDDARAHVLDHAWERYNRPSMLQHVEEGRRTEIDALNGALVKEAKVLGVAAPFNEAVVLAIRSIEARNAARAKSPPVDEAALEVKAREERQP